MSRSIHQINPGKKRDTVITAKATRPRPVPIALKLVQLAFSIGGRLFPVLAGYIAYQLWFTPLRYKTPESEMAALKSAKIRHHTFNQQTIVTYHWGKTGPTVLLVHGWSGRGTQLGAFVPSLVNAGYQVLSFDAPAHGKSSGKQTSLFEITDVLLSLQKLYGRLDSVICHSFGGPCTAKAIECGLKISRVVSIAPPANLRELFDMFIQTLHIPPVAESNLFKRVEKNFGENIWREISMEDIVSAIHIPAIIIHDINDTDIHWHNGRTVARAWNNALFIKTEGLGHRQILRDDTVITTATRFITAGNEAELNAPDIPVAPVT